MEKSCQHPATGLTEQVLFLSPDQPRRTDRVTDDLRQSLRLAFLCQREAKNWGESGKTAINERYRISNGELRKTGMYGNIHSDFFLSHLKQ